MSTMIETVARAISLGEWSDSEHWECRVDRETWMERARAAIEAMREPSFAIRKITTFEFAEDEWPKLIDAALSGDA